MLVSSRLSQIIVVFMCLMMGIIDGAPALDRCVSADTNLGVKALKRPLENPPEHEGFKCTGCNTTYEQPVVCPKCTAGGIKWWLSSCKLHLISQALQSWCLTNVHICWNRALPTRQEDSQHNLASYSSRKFIVPLFIWSWIPPPLLLWVAFDLCWV